MTKNDECISEIERQLAPDHGGELLFTHFCGHITPIPTKIRGSVSDKQLWGSQNICEICYDQETKRTREFRDIVSQRAIRLSESAKWPPIEGESERQRLWAYSVRLRVLRDFIPMAITLIQNQGLPRSVSRQTEEVLQRLVGVVDPGFWIDLRGVDCAEGWADAALGATGWPRREFWLLEPPQVWLVAACRIRWHLYGVAHLDAANSDHHLVPVCGTDGDHDRSEMDEAAAQSGKERRASSFLTDLFRAVRGITKLGF